MNNIAKIIVLVFIATSAGLMHCSAIERSLDQLQEGLKLLNDAVNKDAEELNKIKDVSAFIDVAQNIGQKSDLHDMIHSQLPNLFPRNYSFKDNFDSIIHGKSEAVKNALKDLKERVNKKWIVIQLKDIAKVIELVDKFTVSGDGRSLRFPAGEVGEWVIEDEASMIDMAFDEFDWLSLGYNKAFLSKAFNPNFTDYSEDKTVQEALKVLKDKLNKKWEELEARRKKTSI